MDIYKHFYVKQLNEAIPLSVAKFFAKDWDKSRLADWFDDKYRIYLPLSGSVEEEENAASGVELKVKERLKEHGYEVKDYKKGIVFNKKYNRNEKIGKVLRKIDKDLLQLFNDDKTRTGVKMKKKDPIVVISRHPYDIAGMSTDRGWTSCKNLGTGKIYGKDENEFKPNSAYLKDEVHSLLIAYLVNPKDKNIQNPIARVNIVPYLNNRLQLGYVVEDQTYPKDLAELKIIKVFADTVKEWLKSKQGELKGTYKVNPFAYSDELDPTQAFPENVHEGGVWTKNTWHNGIWKDGRWQGKHWVQGEFRKGTWTRGTWWDGVFGTEDADLTDAIWEDGLWKNGEFYDSSFRKGTWNNGHFFGGVFGIKGRPESAIWNDGVFSGGVFHGTWENGTWEFGDFIDGIWLGGKWEDGIWKGREWVVGWIWDEGKVGNWKPGDLWDEGFVRTRQNPAEYFGLNEETNMKKKQKLQEDIFKRRGLEKRGVHRATYKGPKQFQVRGRKHAEEILRQNNIEYERAQVVDKSPIGFDTVIYKNIDSENPIAMLLDGTTLTIY
jgi:hypothetical protein